MGDAVAVGAGDELVLALSGVAVFDLVGAQLGYPSTKIW